MKSVEQISQKSDNLPDELFFTAPVMIPGERDCDYERGEIPFSAKEIQEIADAYKDYRIVDADHKFLDTGKAVGEAVKSWITDEPLQVNYVDGESTTVPQGTWMATVKITDAETIKRALKGAFTGFSPTVLKKETAETLSAAMKRSAGRTIRSFIDKEPVGFTISLADKPCLRKAKFCKNKVDKMDEDKSFKQQLRAFLGLDEVPEGQIAEKSETEKPKYVTVDEFKEFKDDMFAALKAATNKKKKKQQQEEEEDVSAQDEPDDSASVDEQDGEEMSDDEIDAKIADLQAQIRKLQKMRKGGSTKSKALTQHENHVAKKSDAQTVYEIMGRNRATHMVEKK